jgi:hypothetical protein
MKLKSLLLLGATLCLFACEKPYSGEEAIEKNSNVILRVSSLEQIPFEGEVTARAEGDVTDICSRLNIAIYQDGEKVKALAQKRGDTDYGTAGFSLPEGSYTLVVIAHNSTGTCTFTTLDKITFKDNLVTDTYLYSGTLQVTKEAQTVEIGLHRAVAMFRLVLTDDIPSEVKQLQFYYTGGSSTLSAVTGYGSVNSRQTVKINVDSSQHMFDVYTFPHDETGELKMVISALDANGEVLRQKTLEKVPVTRNRITRYTGSFFGGSTGEVGSVSFNMTASPDWDGEDERTL